MGIDLRTHCLAFCQQLHAHHSEEDDSLFPHLRGLDPELGDVLDQLGKEHRVIAQGLDELQTVFDNYDVDMPAGERDALRARVRDISTDIEAHLDYEEERLVPVLNALPRFPGSDASQQEGESE